MTRSENWLLFGTLPIEQARATAPICRLTIVAASPHAGYGASPRKCKTYTFSLGPTANVLSQVGFASYSVCDRQPFAEENFASDHPLCMRRKEREWVWLRVLSDDLKSGLRANYREKTVLRSSHSKDRKVSVRSRLYGGEGGIRTGPFFELSCCQGDGENPCEHSHSNTISFSSYLSNVAWFNCISVFLELMELMHPI